MELMFEIDMEIWKGIELDLREKIRLCFSVWWPFFCCFVLFGFMLKEGKRLNIFFKKMKLSDVKKKNKRGRMALWKKRPKGLIAIKRPNGLLYLKGLTAYIYIYIYIYIYPDGLKARPWPINGFRAF